MIDFLKKLIPIAVAIISNLMLMVSCSVVENSTSNYPPPQLAETKDFNTIIPPVNTKTFQLQLTPTYQANDIDLINGLEYS